MNTVKRVFIVARKTYTDPPSPYIQCLRVKNGKVRYNQKEYWLVKDGNNWEIANEKDRRKVFRSEEAALNGMIKKGGF